VPSFSEARNSAKPSPTTTSCSSELEIYPLTWEKTLFSLVVFYPIWALVADAPRNLFAFYAAFLNGFFWETVVANARLPSPPNGSNNKRSKEVS